MNKHLGFLALALCFALALSGCSLSRRETEAVDEISLPEPEDEPENMILGETFSGGLSQVALYYASQDGASFSTVTRDLRSDAGQSLPEAAVQALLTSQGPGGTRSMGDVQMLACEFACGTATINLSIDARATQTPQELLSLETAIGNTLLGINGVRCVNVLISGASESCCQLPVGVQTERVASVTASYAQLQAERDRILQADAAPLARSALIYFPTAEGDWLVPELRTINVSGNSFPTALIEAIKAGPLELDCAIDSIPSGVELMDPNPAVETLGTGERVLSLNFTPALVNYLAFSGLAVWKLAASLTLTMTSFLPELDAVRIMVNDDPITMCVMDDGILSFPDGLIRRAYFSEHIGSTATLYLVDASNDLRNVQRAVSMRSALSPKSLLTELFRYAGTDNAPLRLPVPATLRPEDVLGVQTVGGIARVNLSGSFYRNCQTLSPRAERDLVYAMVNTLCELEGIRGVRFYIEGNAADTLAGGIYLKSVLMPNPGLIAPAPVEPSAEEPETAAP